MRAVNLLPADRREHKRRSPLAPLVKEPLLAGSVVVSLAVAVGVVFMAHSAGNAVTTKQNSLRQLDAQIASIPKPKPVTPSAIASTAAVRLTAVTSVVSHRTPWDGFMFAVSRVLPEDVWLLNLAATGPSATAPAVPATPGSTPTAFTVTGYTYSQPSVARLMRRLVLVPWLNDVSLVTSAKTVLGTHTVYQFTVGANVIQLPEVGQ